MRKHQNFTLDFPQAMDVDWGRLLEQQLKQWQGGRTHIRGIAEYISNADDSYIRQGLSKKIVSVEIYSKTGKKISKLIVSDNAEGMSKEDLENKFFQYYKSFSGRESANVSGRFGTGGKAYAIMNYKKCWIISVKDGFEHKAWFEWDSKQKKPIYGYDRGGYYYKPIKKENGTRIELIDSLKNNIALEDLLIMLSSSPRIRGTIKNQEVHIKIDKKGDVFTDKLDYEGVSIKDADRVWEFELPNELKNTNCSNSLRIYYFPKPLKNSQNIIELSDGKTLFIDLNTSFFDERPFSKYLYGEVVVEQLYNADAVKENRKGLEEGNDLTIEINEFLSKSIKEVIQEVQDLQREKEKNRIIEVSQQKISELNKFLRKCDLNFKRELNQLRKRNVNNLDDARNPKKNEVDYGESINIYRKPTEEDSEEVLVRGNWIEQEIDENQGIKSKTIDNGSSIEPKFVENEDGDEFAVLINSEPKERQGKSSSSKGISVIMTDDPNSPDPAELHSEFEDPVIDKYLRSDGIVLVNVNNPIIEKYRSKKQYQSRFNENVANYVLLIVAQYQTQKELEMLPLEEREDGLFNFRRKFFDLQRDLREDNDINYFEFDED